MPNLKSARFHTLAAENKFDLCSNSEEILLKISSLLNVITSEVIWKIDLPIPGGVVNRVVYLIQLTCSTP
ncbi:MAG: hypothetical protein ACREBS_08810 [Nitrososphaerales archaeon]